MEEQEGNSCKKGNLWETRCANCFRFDRKNLSTYFLRCFVLLWLFFGLTHKKNSHKKLASVGGKRRSASEEVQSVQNMDTSKLAKAAAKGRKRKKIDEKIIKNRDFFGRFSFWLCGKKVVKISTQLNFHRRSCVSINGNRISLALHCFALVCERVVRCYTIHFWSLQNKNKPHVSRRIIRKSRSPKENWSEEANEGKANVRLIKNRQNFTRVQSNNDSSNNPQQYPIFEQFHEKKRTTS